MTKEELKQDHNIVQDAWQLLKKYSDVQDEDDYWEQLVNEATEIHKKYNTKFAKDLMIAVLYELEGNRKHDGQH